MVAQSEVRMFPIAVIISSLEPDGRCCDQGYSGEFDAAPLRSTAAAVSSDSDRLLIETVGWSRCSIRKRGTKCTDMTGGSTGNLRQKEHFSHSQISAARKSVRRPTARWWRICLNRHARRRMHGQNSARFSSAPTNRHYQAHPSTIRRPCNSHRTKNGCWPRAGGVPGRLGLSAAGALVGHEKTPILERCSLPARWCGA